jgi:tetratricopeptide (TPR) repeat protein
MQFAAPKALDHPLIFVAEGQNAAPRCKFNGSAKGTAMSEPTRIQVEMAKQISPQQELAIVRAAFEKSPTALMRERLAGLLSLADAFDETVELLSAAADRGFWEEMILVQACLARETSRDDEAARAAAKRALQLSQKDHERAAALAARAKAELRLGKRFAARSTLAEALRLDPRNMDACKRIAALELASGHTDRLLMLADQLAAKGAAHTRLFAARALAHARAGNLPAARDAIGFEAFRHERELEPPPGWGSIGEFNQALAEELLAHPALRYERYGTASELTWRIDAPATGEAPRARLLLDQLAGAIGSHLERIGDADHPWIRARPKSALLRSWCVITEGDGYETWHVHHFGWLSGVYYVRVPDSIASGTGRGGCLSFGLPPDLAGDSGAADYGGRLVRPREGLMLAFPSHAYHRTFPHGTGEKRICVAFDLRPL